MFTTIRKAGLSITEFARIVNVSRVAVYNWKSGRTKPHSMLKEQLRDVVELLELLIERKKLPLSAGLEPDIRVKKVEKLRELLKRYASR